MTEVCDSLCKKYKTKKGYLCNKKEKSKLTGKTWCKINEDDVEIYNKFLDKPNFDKINNYYWDDIIEETPQKMCNLRFSNGVLGDIKYYPCNLSSLKNNFKYILGIFLINLGIAGGTGLTIISSKGSVHLKQTMKLAGSSDKQILIFLVGQLRKILQSGFVNDDIIFEDNLNNIISSLKDEINLLDENNKEQIGSFIKNLFQIASNTTKNTQYGDGINTTSVIDFFIKHIPNEHAMEILKGGNFVIEDNGELYDWSKNNMSGYGRFSSHAKNATDVIQQGYTDMFGDTYLHLLCGKYDYKEGNKSVSWCQFEGAPMPEGSTTLDVFQKAIHGYDFKKSFQEYADHFVDSAYYFYVAKVSSKIKQLLGNPSSPINLALGISLHTDQNPMYLLPFNLKEIKQLPNDSNFEFNFIKNNLTYNLGIHNSIMSNLTNTNENVITSEEMSEKSFLKAINKQNEIRNIGINNTTTQLGNQLGSQLYLPAAQANFGQLLLSRGGKIYKKKRKTRKIIKHKKTKTNRNKK